jgi:BirA family transcriptional regulator, biotin operon repressor / biotin---[acetyl-CoA-carboxylase] ligase
MFDTQLFLQNEIGSFGRELFYFERLESTNNTAAALAKENCPEGTVVLANEQTKGRGRKGNVWYSPGDVNLYFSVVLYPDSTDLRYLPYMAGMAVIHSLSNVGIKPDLKWPNDILASGKKISGVMIETSMEQNQARFAVMGCGINVNETSLPDELQQSATSVALETGSPVSRESLLAAFLIEFERLYKKIKEFQWEDFCAELAKHSTYLKGAQVRIVQDGESFEGVTSGLDSYGGLILASPTAKKAFYAGEVQACRKS